MITGGKSLELGLSEKLLDMNQIVRSIKEKKSR